MLGITNIYCSRNEKELSLPAVFFGNARDLPVGHRSRLCGQQRKEYPMRNITKVAAAATIAIAALVSAISPSLPKPKSESEPGHDL
jgi:hypothetical protein